MYCGFIGPEEWELFLYWTQRSCMVCYFSLGFETSGVKHPSSSYKTTQFKYVAPVAALIKKTRLY
jgi:hypothetical protein